MKRPSLAWLMICPFLLLGCPRDKSGDSLTPAEANQALEESTIDSQGQGLASEAIELSTSFTLGQAVQASAQELAAFITSQLGCAAVSVSGTSVTVTYAANGGCLYHGHVITGKSEITITKNEPSEIIVDHRWTALSNGIVQLDGTATVAWSQANLSRHVVHDIVIERLRDQKTVDSSGDRTQTALNGDPSIGIAVTGMRSWTSASGTWALSIDKVQMRWVDPVPQAGTYTLLTPKNKTLTLSFLRADADTITVTLSGENRSFSFDVASSGEATAR